MSFLNFGLSFLFLLTLVACQSAPTKVYETQPVIKKTNIVITSKTVIIDARPAFDYSLSHMNGSIPMRWEEFSEHDIPYRGLLEMDLFTLTRRLARYGISLDTPIVVVGRGPQGEGEEGRVAWTLQVLGIRQVQFANINAFSLPLTRLESPPKVSVPMWKPQVVESLRVDRSEFVYRNVPKITAQQNNIESAIVIDVRTEAEYLGKDTKSPYSKSAPHINAINIPWTQFFDKYDNINTEISSRLEQVGISKNKIIYVIDNFGVRSAAVTLALRQLGYSKAANFAGGYMQLVGK